MNFFDDIPPGGEAETFLTVAQTAGFRVERIVSHGQASPPGFWYDQPQDEWVLVLEGSAGVLIYGEAAPRILRRGDHLLIPARQRHRVAWTAPDGPTIWLAVHASAAPQ